MAETKERLEIKKQEKEAVRVIEKQTEVDEVPRSVETWMRKVETNSMKSVNDDTGQPVLQPSTPVSPKVKLPVTRKTFASGLKKSMEDAGKWLSTFVFRLIKINKGEVEFKEE